MAHCRYLFIGRRSFVCLPLSDDAVPTLCGHALCGHVFIFLLGRPRSEIAQPWFLHTVKSLRRNLAVKPTSGCSWAVSREFYQFSQTPLTGGSSGPALLSWGLGLLSVALASVVWPRAVINAFCFKADTSQIITYRCSKAFMWGRRMRGRAV